MARVSTSWDARHSVEERVLFRSKMDRLHYADAEPYDVHRAGCLSHTYRMTECKHYKSSDRCGIEESPIERYKALLPILQAEPTLICAGGIVWRHLHKCRCANDADMWIVDTSARALCDKYRDASACVMRCVDMIRKIHGGVVRISHASHHITVQIGTDNSTTPVKYQFVLRVHDTIGDLLRTFDFPLAQIAYDGVRYWSTRAGAWCNDNGVCMVDPTRMHPGSYGRCVKYARCISVCVVGMPAGGQMTVGDEDAASLKLKNGIWGSDDIAAEYASVSGEIYCMDAIEQAERNSRYMYYGRDGFVAKVVELYLWDNNACEIMLNTPVRIADIYPYVSYGRTGDNMHLSYWRIPVYDTLLDAGMHPLEIAEYIREQDKERVDAINARLQQLVWTQDKFPLAPDTLMMSHPRWRGVKLGNITMERCLRLARMRYPFAVLPRDVFLIILSYALLMDNGI